MKNIIDIITKYGDVIDKCNKKELFNLLSYEVNFLDKGCIKSGELVNQIIYSIENNMKTMHHFYDFEDYNNKDMYINMKFETKFYKIDNNYDNIEQINKGSCKFVFDKEFKIREIIIDNIIEYDIIYKKK